jgi:hypothetical protein
MVVAATVMLALALQSSRSEELRVVAELGELSAGLGELSAGLGVSAAGLGVSAVGLGVSAVGLGVSAAVLPISVAVLPISVEASEGWALDLKAYWSYKDCGRLAWEPVDSQDHAVGQRLRYDL